MFGLNLRCCALSACVLLGTVAPSIVLPAIAQADRIPSERGDRSLSQRPPAFILGATQTNQAVALYVNGQNQGWVVSNFAVNRDQPLRLFVPSLLARLPVAIRASWQGPLQNAADERGTISLSDLQASGMHPYFDEQHLALHLHSPTLPLVPVEKPLPTPQPLYLQRTQDLGDPFATATGAGGNSPRKLNVTTAVSLGDRWRLESQTHVADNMSAQWLNSDLHLVGVDPQGGLMLEIGDLDIPTAEFQQSYRMVGLGVNHQFGHSPPPAGAVTEPTDNHHQTACTVRSSSVALSVDNSIQRTWTAPPRPADGISNCPPAELEAAEAGVNKEVLAATTTSADALLPTAPQELSYSFGIPFTYANGTRSFDSEMPRLAVLYRINPTSTLAFDSFFHGNSDRQVVGLSGRWSPFADLLEWDLLVSHTSETETGSALQFRYKSSWPMATSAQSVGLAVMYRDENFTTLDEVATPNRQALELSLSYELPLVNTVLAQLNGRYRFSQLSLPDTYQVTIHLSAPLSETLDTGLKFSYDSNQLGEADETASFTIDWELPS